VNDYEPLFSPKWDSSDMRHFLGCCLNDQILSFELFLVRSSWINITYFESDFSMQRLQNLVNVVNHYCKTIF